MRSISGRDFVLWILNLYKSMFEPNYFRLVMHHKKTVAAIVVLVFVIGAVITLLMPFQYGANVKFLVIQKAVAGYDAYSAAKSAEKIGSNLAQVVYSNSFFNKVMNAGFGVDEKYFNIDENKKREQWQKMVTAELVGTTSVLSITVYHKDRDQALKLSQAIAYVLSTQSAEYVGIGDIDLKMIESPLASKYIEKPNFLVNGIVSILVGLLIGVGWVVVRS
jgi:capsular polysaccharide biosynthesis protein